MPLYITEYAGGYLSGRPLFPGIPIEPAIQTQVMSGLTTAAQTMSTLSATTRLVRLHCDVPQFVYFGTSTMSTTSTAASSTNSERMPAGVEVFRVVSAGSRIIASST